jgi:3-oxoacyl-[acyl-carrier-protein] synthase-3
MNGREVYKHAVRNLTDASKAALEANGLTTADIDLIVAHQANLRIVEGVAQRMDVSMDRFHINIQKYGNTSSASIPIALHEAIQEGKVKPKDTLLFCALGAGLSWGSAIVRY